MPRSALGVGCATAIALLGAPTSAAAAELRLSDALEAHAAVVLGQPAVSAKRAATTARRPATLEPAPADAYRDRGRLWNDGCLTKGKRRHSKRCVYGKRSSKTTVVVFGDSHALQYFPAMRVLARKNDWRLVGLVRASCTIAAVNYQPTCNAWRRNTVRRIVKRERPSLIVVSGGTHDRFEIKRNGDRISRRASQRYLERGMARTLSHLRRAGRSRIALIRAQATAPFTVAKCVARHRRNPNRHCSFRPRRSETKAFDVRGARRMSAPVTVIDPFDAYCRKRRCRAVIGNRLVYRDREHISATYSRSLASWLERELPTPKRLR